MEIKVLSPAEMQQDTAVTAWGISFLGIICFWQYTITTSTVYSFSVNSSAHYTDFFFIVMGNVPGVPYFLSKLHF